MLIYHGSNVIVNEPKVDLGRKKVDFGQGFYCSTLPEQAENWAFVKSNDFGEKPIVSVFEYVLDNSLKLKTFYAYSKEWLDFVVKNRTNDKTNSDSNLDIIEGNIADDKVIQTIDNYIEEIKNDRFSEELVSFTLKQLVYQKPNNQICFSTEKSLKTLKFIKSYEVNIND